MSLPLPLTPPVTPPEAPETKSQTTPEDSQFYKFKEISDFCLQSFAEKHQRICTDDSRGIYKHFADPATHAKQMWRIQEEILEHKHKDVGKKLARMMGGVTFYSIRVLLPPGDNAYGVPEGERLFVRYRRWSSFNNLREQLENKGGFPVLPRTLFRGQIRNGLEIVGSEHPGGPYLCPAKTRLFANKSTCHKRSSAFGKWLQCLLGHECEEVVNVTKQWLRSPDDGEGRVRPPTNEEDARLDEALRKPSNKRRLQQWLVDYHTKENTSRGHPNTWNTSQITNMSQLFRFKREHNGRFWCFWDFNEDISGWDVSNVITMEEMFKDCEVFNQPIGNWDVSNVKNMKNMFRSAVAFNQSVGNWNVSNVENMASMFHRAKAFNQPLHQYHWDVSNVKNMSHMFQETEAFNQPIGDWHVSNVKDMDSMFYQARAFNQPIPWGERTKFRTNGQDAIIWKEEHREKSNYREYNESEARRQRIEARKQEIEARTTKAAADVKAAAPAMAAAAAKVAMQEYKEELARAKEMLDAIAKVSSSTTSTVKREENKKELKLSWPEVVGMTGKEAVGVIFSEPHVYQANTVGPYDPLMAHRIREMHATMAKSSPNPAGVVKVVVTAAGKIVQSCAQVEVEVDAEGKVIRIPKIVQIVVDAEGNNVVVPTASLPVIPTTSGTY